MHFSDDKLFRCDRCPFRTPLKHHMTSHRMNHDDDKPFSCNLCDYRAVSQSMVNSHKKSHSTVRPYVCDYPRCHYATKFVNQLTKHREKQHPGFVPPVDGAVRRRRPSTSVPPLVTQTRSLSYPDDKVSALPPTVHRQPAAAVHPPPLPDDLTARNAATMLPWSMPPWSPFNFLQRMAAAAAVSGLPLCSPSPMSLSAQRSLDMKPFQLPPSTLPSSESLESVSGEHGLTRTPQKPSTFDGRRDVLLGGMSSSLRSTTATSDVDTRRSFLGRIAAAATGANTHVNIAGDDATPGAPGVRQALAPASADCDVSRTLRTLKSPSPWLRSNEDCVSNNDEAHSGGDLNKCTSVCGPGGPAVDDDHPLDLTAKTSMTTQPTEHAADAYRPLVTSNNGQQLSVRKTSRRKGVAHKLDTTSINRWMPADVTNEPFDLVPPSTSAQTASDPQLLVSSAQASWSDPRGSSDCLQNAAEATLNGVGRSDEDEDVGSLSDKADVESSARRQRQISPVSGVTRRDADADDPAVADVVDYRKVDGADVGRESTPRSNECRHCGFVFRYPAMFDIHMGFHKFDDPWRCNRCGQRCTDCVDFNRHIATAPHPGQV